MQSHSKKDGSKQDIKTLIKAFGFIVLSAVAFVLGGVYFLESQSREEAVIFGSDSSFNNQDVDRGLMLKNDTISDIQIDLYVNLDEFEPINTYYPVLEQVFNNASVRANPFSREGDGIKKLICSTEHANFFNFLSTSYQSNQFDLDNFNKACIENEDTIKLTEQTFSSAELSQVSDLAIFINGIEVPVYKAYSEILILQNQGSSNDIDIFTPVTGTGEDYVRLFADATETLSKEHFDTLIKLAEEGTITLEFVPFFDAQDRPNSLDVAASQFCAGADRFFEYTQKLFEINDNNELFLDRLTNIYKDIGGDTEKFRSCMSSKQLHNHVLTLQNEPQFLGAFAPPFVLVNGEKQRFLNAQEITEFFQN